MRPALITCAPPSILTHSKIRVPNLTLNLRADHDAIEQQLNDGDPPGTARGGQEQRPDASAEYWTRIRKDNHACDYTLLVASQVDLI